MEKNMGKNDRLIRAVIGVVIGVAGIYYESWWGAVGLVPLITALLGWCPAYCPFNISTKKHGA